MKISYVRKPITIKRRIIPDERLIKFIRYNCDRRRHIWNKFVEEYKRCKTEGTFIDLVRYTTAINNIEKSNLKQAIVDGDDEVVKMWCSDIPKSVYNDVKSSIKLIKTNWEKHKRRGELHFKNFDPCRHSFRVRACNTINPDSHNPMGKVHFTDSTHMTFKASDNFTRNIFHITLKEPICDEYHHKKMRFVSYCNKYSSRERYDFYFDDIKEIIFMEELGKFYIMLQCDVTYYNYSDDLKDRKKVAGVDLGIKNPVTIYDGVLYPTAKIDEESMKKLRGYTKKAYKIQLIMNKKLRVNRAINETNSSWPLYSKRHAKLRIKFRKLCKRASNIRYNWRNKLSNRMARAYKALVVDEFNTPTNKSPNISDTLRHIYNVANREHAIWEFTRMLQHEAIKWECQYIQSPMYTTCTCSQCYHINDKLDLSCRELVCEKCGITIDRDANAAMNCYDAYIHRSRWRFE